MLKAFLFGAGLIVLASLAACVEETPLLSEAERAACEAQGGETGSGGMLPDEICFLPTPDGGKSCKKASDCSAHCLADSMTCSKITPQFGCFKTIMDDGQLGGVCMD